MVRKKTTNRPLVRVLVLAFIMLLAACGGGEDPADRSAAPEDVDETRAGTDEPTDDGAAGDATPEAEDPVQVSYAITAATAGPAQSPYSSLPVALGYWEDEGLDVEVTPLSGSEPAVNGLISGSFDVISSGLSPAMAAINQGAEIVVYYNQVTTSFAFPAVLPDSSYQRPADLEGTRLGVQALGSGITATVLGLVELDGGDPSTIEQIPVGLAAEALHALETGRVDALGLWDEQYAGMELLGTPVRTLHPESEQSIAFQVGLVTQTNSLTERPDVLVKVARGIAKAYAFAFENPEEAIRLHFEMYPESKPTDVSDEEAIQQGVKRLQSRMENSQKINDTWGWVEPQTVTNYAELLASADALPEALDASSYWNDALLGDINDFDEAEVRSGS